MLKLKAIKEWEDPPLLFPPHQTRPSLSFCCFPIMPWWLEVVVFYTLSSIYSCYLWWVSSIGSTWPFKEAENFPKNFDAVFFFFLIKNFPEGLPWWLSAKEFACQCRRHGFNSWCGKIPHALEQLGSCATTTEPVLWSLGTTATEVRGPQREATATRSARLERSPTCHN